MSDHVERAARILHAAMTKQGLAQSWETCNRRMDYRNAARDLLKAIEEGL